LITEPVGQDMDVVLPSHVVIVVVGTVAAIKVYIALTSTFVPNMEKLKHEMITG